jgi:tetratricopeptide (TPR) repeat protein
VRLASIAEGSASRRTSVAAREELADLYRVLGRPFDEVTELKALADGDATTSRRVSLAMAEARQGQFDAALTTLNAALPADRDSAAVLLGRARVQLGRAERLRDWSSAVTALRTLERALGGTARRSEGLALYGRALYLTGDVAGATRVLRDAVTTSPIDLEAFDFLADAAERTSPLEARDALLSLDALEGDTASPSRRSARARRVGLLSWRLGDAASAATYLQQALDAGHDTPEISAPLVEAYWRLGDSARAKAALDRALTRDPRHPALLRLARSVVK